MFDDLVFKTICCISIIMLLIDFLHRRTKPARADVAKKNRPYTVDFMAGGRKVFQAENAYTEDGFIWFVDVNGKDVACIRPEHLASFEVTEPTSN